MVDTWPSPAPEWLRQRSDTTPDTPRVKAQDELVDLVRNHLGLADVEALLDVARTMRRLQADA